MGLSVKSSRCATITMIIFGVFVLTAAAAYITFSIIYEYLNIVSKLVFPSGSTEWILTLSWYLGYPSLLAIITMVTGCIGICASAHRARPNTCLTVTLFIFSLMVASLSGFAIFDLGFKVKSMISYLRDHKGNSSVLVLFLSIEGSLLGLAIVVFILSFWAMICCLASCCCHTEVVPEPVPARQQPMQGAAMVPMMRTGTMPIIAPAHPVMMQAVPVMPVSQVVPVAPVNQAFQQPSQAMPMGVVAPSVVMKSTQEPDNGTVA